MTNILDDIEKSTLEKNNDKRKETNVCFLNLNISKKKYLRSEELLSKIEN